MRRWGNFTNTTSARGSRLTSAVMSCWWYDVMKMIPYIFDLPQNSPSQSNHEKNISQIPTEGCSTKHWPIFLKMIKVIKKQGKSEIVTNKRSIRKHDN